MKRILLVSIFACALGAVSLHAMEMPDESIKKLQEIYLGGKEIKNLYLHIGLVTNETNRELTNIEIVSKGIKELEIPSKQMTVSKIKSNETIKVFKGPVIFQKNIRTRAPFALVYLRSNGEEILIVKIVKIEKNIKALLFDVNNNIISSSSLTLESDKETSLQFDLVLRDGPNGEPFEDSEIELHAKQ